MLKADYSAERPDIDVKSTGFKVGNLFVIQVEEVEFTLNERDAKELYEDLDGELHSESRGDIEDKLEKVEERISELEDEISNLKAEISQLEGERQ